MRNNAGGAALSGRPTDTPYTGPPPQTHTPTGVCPQPHAQVLHARRPSHTDRGRPDVQATPDRMGRNDQAQASEQAAV